MAIADNHHHHHRHNKSNSDLKLFRLCPFWQSGGPRSSSSSYSQNLSSHSNRKAESKPKPNTVSSVARSLIPPRRRLRLDPGSSLYFPCMSSLFSFSSDFFLRWLWIFDQFDFVPKTRHFQLGFAISPFSYFRKCLLNFSLAILKQEIYFLKVNNKIDHLLI